MVAIGEEQNDFEFDNRIGRQMLRDGECVSTSNW